MAPIATVAVTGATPQRHETAGAAEGYRIDIEHIRIGARGPVYRATHYGEVIVERSRQPFLDAARVFRDAGVSGRLEMWRPGADGPAMVGDIGRCAGLTVAENEHHGPRFARYEPLPSAGIAFAGAASDQGQEF